MWENEVLGQRYEKVKEDRDLIFDKYNCTLQEIQQKGAFKRVLLHKKIEVVESQLERKDAQLGELFRVANVDPASMQGVERKLNDMVDGKNRTIQELQELLASVTARHEKFVAGYETYLKQNGVPVLSPN